VLASVKTFSFPAVPDRNGQIALLAEVTSALPPNRAVEVLVVLREEGDSENEDEEGAVWRSSLSLREMRTATLSMTSSRPVAAIER
jgi:hypothetical protein